MGEVISFSRPDGAPCPGYLAESSRGATGHGVVLIQEWWGLNPQIQKMADRFAEAGYRTLVPDLFRGKITADASEAGHLMNGLNFVDAAEQDIQGAVDHLRKTSSNVAVVGFCMGGALTLISAVRVRGMDAGVCFYGIPPREVADPKRITIPLLCHFAQKDDWCSPAAVEALEIELRDSKSRFEISRYDAQHAFMNEARPEVYDGPSAKKAWDRTVDFLGRVLP